MPQTIQDVHYARLDAYRHSREYAAYRQAPAEGVAPDGLPSLLGDRWEIDHDTYWYFLEVLPPLNMTRDGFVFAEYTFGDITTRYTEAAGRYYCEFVRWPEV